MHSVHGALFYFDVCEGTFLDHSRFQDREQATEWKFGKINLVRKTVNSSFENRQGQEGAKRSFSD